MMIELTEKQLENITNGHEVEIEIMYPEGVETVWIRRVPIMEDKTI